MPRRRRHKKGAGQSEPPPSPGPDTTPNQGPAPDCPYVVQHSDVMGWYLVSSRRLAAGAVLVAEEPLVVGPAQDCLPVCLGCYTPDPQHRCEDCGWPLCSARCSGLHQPLGHSRGECDALRGGGASGAEDMAPHYRYNAVVPLRCLLLKAADPCRWAALLDMEAHNAVRRGLPHIWGHNQRTVVDRIRNGWGLTEYSEDEIHTVCGVLEVNAFAVGDDSLNVRALYPTAALLAHSCVPNTAHTDDPQYRLTLYTSVAVDQGRPVTLSYTNSLHGTKKRREHLKQCKFFDCTCERCADPTELGTYLSGVRCRACGGGGTLLPSDPLDPAAPWRCDGPGCQGKEGAADVDRLVERIEAELKVAGSDVSALEGCLERYSPLLHTNHYLLLGLRYSLSQLYGKSPGYLLPQLTAPALERKAQHCQHILNIFNVLEPGLSRIRGLTMYELHAPIMVLTIQRFEERQITKTELSTRLRKVAGYLREAIDILRYETEGSTEGVLRAAAEDALHQLTTWEPIVGKLH